MKSYGKMMYAASIDVTDVFSLFDAVTIEGSTALETSTGLSLCRSCYVMGARPVFRHVYLCPAPLAVYSTRRGGGENLMDFWPASGVLETDAPSSGQ